MKKLFLMMGLASLFMVACNNAPKQPEQPAEPETVVAEEHHCPFCPLKAEYANWDNMDETAKAELNKKAYDLFAQMDAEMEAKKAECEANGEAKPCCKEGEEHKCAHEGEHKCQHEGEAHQCNHEGEHKCAHEGEHQCQHEMPELTEEQKAECEAKCAEMKAKCEEMKAAWEKFAELSLDEQKDLILGRIEFMKGMQCHHEGEGEEHHCQHEGEGHQCQHGEGHQCDHAK